MSDRYEVGEQVLVKPNLLTPWTEGVVIGIAQDPLRLPVVEYGNPKRRKAFFSKQIAKVGDA